MARLGVDLAPTDLARYAYGMEHLVGVVQALSLARDVETIVDTVRRAARSLTGADGATFVLREGDLCHYVEEDAIGPLWKGRRFPMVSCITGWSMLNRQSVVIPDIFADSRVPIDAYRPTFVKSLAVVPIRTVAPIGAIGNYWATNHAADAVELRLLQALADSASVAIENVQLVGMLERRVEEAREAVHVRDEFLANAAHVLRNPVNAIELQVQALRLAGSKDERTERLESTTRGLARELDRLLEVSWLSRGSLRLDRTTFDLADLVREVVGSFEEFARAAGCGILLDVAPAIGSWDRSRVRQAVSALLSNAIKFGARAPVHVSVSASHPIARVTVRDHGSGVANDDVARIFERFGRAAPPPLGGLGLGLYLAREIASAHGGSIFLDTSAPQGATFVIELPLT